MPTTLRQPLRGRDIFSLTARGQSANAAGTFANSGSSQSYHAICDEVSYRGRNLMDQIAAVTSPFENNVIIARDDSVVLREILRTGTDAQLLALTFFLAGTDFIYFTIQRGYPAGTAGGGAAVARIQFYGVMGEYREVWRKGKMTGELPIRQIDVTDQNNPLYDMVDL